MNGILQNLYKLQTMDSARKPADASQAAALRAGIPQAMLTNYDRARARGKKGVAMLGNHVCSNCRMRVPIAVAAALAAGRVEVCGNCGIYLCLPEKEAQPAAVVAQGGRRNP